MSFCFGSGTGVTSLRGPALAEGRVIEGVVNAAYEAVIPLSLQSPVGETREVAP